MMVEWKPKCRCGKDAWILVDCGMLHDGEPMCEECYDECDSEMIGEVI